MIKFFLLLAVVLCLDATATRSCYGKNGALRAGWQRLSATRPIGFNRWLKSAFYGGAMLAIVSTPPATTLAVDNAASERRAAIELSPSVREIANEPLQVSSWSISLTRKGTIAHMHMQTVEEEEQLRIATYLEPTAKGRKYLAATPLSHYRADKHYAVHHRSYNGFTLPLRLQWLAVHRYEQLTEIEALLAAIVASERALLALGERMYRGFGKLRIASSDGYGFDNIAEQHEIKFAGKRYVDERHEIMETIGRRRILLETGRMPYRERRHDVHLDQTALSQAEDAYYAVFTRAPQASTPPAIKFVSTMAQDDDFRDLATSLVQLKWARLLLAEEILALYKPLRVPYFFSAGDVQEKLMLTVSADDKERKGVAFRYKMHTNSVKHRKRFLFGEVDFDHQLDIKKMWVSLKPRGGLAKFAKLTSTPCHEGHEPPCPAPDFGD